MGTRHFDHGFKVYAANNEDKMIRKVKTKIENGPQLQRAALGDIRNKATFINSKVVLKKDVAKPLKTWNKSKTTEKAVVKDKENIYNKPEPVKLKDESMEVDETVEVNMEELSIAFSSQTLEIEDIDAEDEDNPQLVSQYVKDIYKYLWEIEEQHKVTPNYLEGQKITYKMRAILIDWLIQVHLKFSLLQETLYLTVAIIDHYLMTNRSTVKDQLQLVGVTAMLIASKYEEMYIPEIEDFVYITDKTFKKADIIRMEVKMLNTLDFYISYPLPLHFLRRNSKAGKVDAAQHTLAKYLMELTLPEYTFCHVKPSLLAAAALYLSMNLINTGSTWSDTLLYYSNYSVKDLVPLVRKLSSLVIKSNSSKLKAIRNKYSHEKFLNISNLKELESSSRSLRKFATLNGPM